VHTVQVEDGATIHNMCLSALTYSKVQTFSPQQVSATRSG
jgi:hypothetical protein